MKYVLLIFSFFLITAAAQAQSTKNYSMVKILQDGLFTAPKNGTLKKAILFVKVGQIKSMATCLQIKAIRTLFLSTISN